MPTSVRIANQTIYGLTPKRSACMHVLPKAAMLMFRKANVIPITDIIKISVALMTRPRFCANREQMLWDVPHSIRKKINVPTVTKKTDISWKMTHVLSSVTIIPWKPVFQTNTYPRHVSSNRNSTSVRTEPVIHTA